MFQNYIDAERPAHNPAATHYGIYVDNAIVPKRIMSMGILANETPSVLEDTGTRSREVDGLIYCPGVNDDGIRHDWYQSHHAAEEATPSPPPPPPKEDLVLIVDASYASSDLVVTVRNMAGEEKFVNVTCPSDTLGALRAVIEPVVNPGDKYNLELMMIDGTILDKTDDEWILEMIWTNTSLAGAAAEEEAPPAPLQREYSKTRTNVAEVLGLAGPDDKVRATFEALDKDGMGFILKDELSALLLKLAPTYTPDDLERAFSHADKDQDGKIDWEDFLEWIFGNDMPLEVWTLKRPQVKTVLQHQFSHLSMQSINEALDKCNSNGSQAAAQLRRETSGKPRKAVPFGRY
jgi:hypothetical protein